MPDDKPAPEPAPGPVKPPRDTPPKAVKVNLPPPKEDKEPPKETPKARPRTDAKAKAPGSGKGRKPELQVRIEGGFMTIALGVSVLNFQDGQIIGENAEALGAAWYKVARQNEAVRVFFERMTQTGAWGEAIAATAMVAIPIAQHHDLIPGEFSILGGLGGSDDEE